MKQTFPEKIMIADMKTCDAGKQEAVQAFKAGADLTAVMAFSADQTILDLLEVARQYGKRVMIDFLRVKEQRLLELGELKADLVFSTMEWICSSNRPLTRMHSSCLKGFNSWRYQFWGNYTEKLFLPILKNNRTVSLLEEL